MSHTLLAGADTAARLWTRVRRAAEGTGMPGPGRPGHRLPQAAHNGYERSVPAGSGACGAPA